MPFEITDDVTIPVGTYRFWSPSVRFNSDPSRRLSASASYSPQGFFGRHAEGLANVGEPPRDEPHRGTGQFQPE